MPVRFTRNRYALRSTRPMGRAIRYGRYSRYRIRRNFRMGASNWSSGRWRRRYAMRRLALNRRYIMLRRYRRIMY
jgi:hypothetical protein